MKEKRSMFKMIFGGKQPPPSNQQTYMQLLNSASSFTDFSGTAYDSDTVRATVDAFARNVGKLKPKHIKRINGKIEAVDSDIAWLLQTKPNRFMNAYIFYYRLATQFLMNNNVFVWIRRDGFNKVEGFYPLVSSGVELYEVAGDMVVQFRFYDGNTYRAPYSDVIHLRRFFYQNDMFGESNSKALTPILNLISIANQSISNAVKSSNLLRGILKFIGMIKDTDMEKATNAFSEKYLSAANTGGIAATDAKMEYQELKSDPKMIDEKLMNAMSDKVFDYFGSNKKIVQSSYNEQEWDAYYESMIETFALQLGLELTCKVFSDRQQGHGNEIVVEANRLQYASNETKRKLAETLVDRGLMSKNEAREMFNMSPIDGGDEFIVSLNFVNADKADEYQLGKPQPKKPDAGGGEKKDDGKERTPN